MSKTALGAAVGSLVCDGSIKSLDDEIGTYAFGLRETAYNKISIRNVFTQMNSGVTPLGRRDKTGQSNGYGNEKKFAGNADVLAAVQHFKVHLASRRKA